MVYGLWQSAAGLQAQDYRQAVLANNLANTETPGFKADRVAFTERLAEAQRGAALGARHDVLDALSGGPLEAPVYTDYAQGSLIPTGNSLDIAVVGDGFLTVQTPEGPRFTRDGRLSVDRDGVVVHEATQRPVLSDQGQSIRVDPGSGEPISIDANGLLRQGREAIERLGIAAFADSQALEKQGEGLLSGAGARRIPAKSELRSGFIEGSGVEPISAMVQMIESTRAYQMNANLLSLQDESLGRAVNDLGRIG